MVMMCWVALRVGSVVDRGESAGARNVFKILICSSHVQKAHQLWLRNTSTL